MRSRLRAKLNLRVMTQKDMETRLIALEAEYEQKKLEADAQIRREQKEIANAEANYHNAVRHHKDVIRTLEQANAWYELSNSDVV